MGPYIETEGHDLWQKMWRSFITQPYYLENQHGKDKTKQNFHPCKQHGLKGKGRHRESGCVTMTERSVASTVKIRGENHDLLHHQCPPQYTVYMYTNIWWTTTLKTGRGLSLWSQQTARPIEVTYLGIHIKQLGLTYPSY